jgi:hypothetical protein
MSESSPPRSYPETAQLKALARGQWGEIYQRLLGWTPQQTSG